MRFLSATEFVNLLQNSFFIQTLASFLKSYLLFWYMRQKWKCLIPWIYKLKVALYWLFFICPHPTSFFTFFAVFHTMEADNWGLNHWAPLLLASKQILSMENTGRSERVGNLFCWGTHCFASAPYVWQWLSPSLAQCLLSPSFSHPFSPRVVAASCGLIL